LAIGNRLRVICDAGGLERMPDRLRRLLDALAAGGKKPAVATKPVIRAQIESTPLSDRVARAQA
jgi:hypothetical protein